MIKFCANSLQKESKLKCGVSGQALFDMTAWFCVSEFQEEQVCIAGAVILDLA